MSTSCSPARTVTPPISVSSVATRHMLWIGVTQRMNSSTATVRSAPSRRSAHCSGRAASSRIVRAMTVRVVSAPPSSSSSESLMTSATPKSWPGISAAVHTDITSSAGQARLAS